MAARPANTISRMAAAEPFDPSPRRALELPGSLRVRAARGTIVNAAFLIVLSALTLVKGFILAGFLARDDYGLWGVLAVSLATLFWLKQVGIDDKYIQQDEPDQELAFQKAFTLELFFTGGFCLLGAAALPLFALAYDIPDLIAPGLLVLFGVFSLPFQAPLWVYYRRMQFARQRFLQAVDPIVGFVVSVTLAAAGLGYWALAIGVTVGAWSAAVAAIAFAPFKLRLRFEGETLRSYATFSAPLFAAAAASAVMAQSAMFAANAELGLAAAGVIALAANITAFTDRVDDLVTGTLYPAICAVRDRTALLFESFVKSNRLALMWAVPFGTALTLFASDLVDFGIGDRWEPAVVVLEIYGLTAAVNHIGFNWSAYFRARGETKPMAVVAVAAMTAFLAVGIPLLLLYGLPGFAAGIAFQGLVALVVRTYYLRRLFEGFGFFRHAVRAFLPTVPAAVVVLLARVVESGDRTLAIALAELGAYIALTAAATWYFESVLLREAFGYLRDRRPAGAAA